MSHNTQGKGNCPFICVKNLISWVKRKEVLEQAGREVNYAKRVSSRRGIANLTAALFFLCRSGSQILVQSSSFPVKQTLRTIVTSGESVQMTGFNLQAILRAMSPRVKGEEKSENFGDSPNLVKMNVAKHKSNFGR